MNNLLLVIVITIIILLVVRAWRKDTVELEMPELTPKIYNKLPYIPNIPKKEPKKKKRKNRSSREQICRDIFEEIFNEKFPTKRPGFLKNPETGRNLELDGFCEPLKLAFEYNGAQHYKFPNTFHRTRFDFDKQVSRDKFKIQRCEEEGVRLISIPYTVPTEKLKPYIKLKLKKLSDAIQQEQT